MERLNKVLSHAGLASRRGADRLIEEGRVTVNGTVVTALGTLVDPARDAIKVDGKRLPAPPTAPLYYALHKPRGYVTTLSDPQGRPTVRELLKGVRRRVYPVGRLDFHSEGLLLLTDDGTLARDLMHPRSGVRKTYSVKVRGQPDRGALTRLVEGIDLDRRLARAETARITRPGGNAWLESTVSEGRKHLVRRMLAAVGHPVVRLRRIRYGNVGLGRLAPGEVRPLTPGEVQGLQRLAAGKGKKRAGV